MRRIFLVSLWFACVGCEEEPTSIPAKAAPAECVLPEDVRLLEDTEELLRARIRELEAEQIRADPKELEPPVPALLADLAASKPKNDPDNVWKRTRAQGVQMGRMFVSEDGSSIRRKAGGGTEGELTLDHRFIVQTVYSHRRSRSSFEGWIDVMKFLSPHVGRVKEPKAGTRQRWTSKLPANGGDPPDTWIDCKVVEEGEDCDGDWRIHGPYWVALREATVDLWLTEVIAQRMKKHPIKWGNAGDVVRFLKTYPDTLCALDTDTKNFFLARPGEGCELGDPATEAAREGRHLRDGP